MELLYVQTLLDYKHLEPSGQKETVRRHVFDVSTSPDFSAKYRDESIIRFWNQVAPLHFSKNPRSFSESGCRTEFDKKPRFKPKRGSFSDKSKCRYKLRNACDNQVDRNDPHDCDAGKERIEQQCDA